MSITGRCRWCLQEAEIRAKRDEERQRMERVEAAKQAVVERCGMSPSATTVGEGGAAEEAVCRVEGEGRASECCG